MQIGEIDEKIKEKKIIIFDLDMTLSESKVPIDNEMALLLNSALSKYKISVISGGKLEQIEKNVLLVLNASNDLLSNLYLQPTSGGALYALENGKLKEIYNRKIPDVDRAMIISLLEEAILESEVDMPEEIYGERIEDRGAQITFSAFGQKAPMEVKGDWDIDKKKRQKIQEIFNSKLSKYEASIGGSSSIDINEKGLSKGYGIVRLIDELKLYTSDVLFVGDRLEIGGNDYSVIETGVDWINVSSSEETKEILRKLIT